METLVKLSCTLAHGNAFLERGMGLTKRVVDGKESLSDTSVKAKKILTSVIKRYRGAPNVPITNELMSSVMTAGTRYKKKILKSKEDAVTKAKNDAQEAEATRKRKLEEASTRNWEEKRETLESEIKSCKEFIIAQDAIQAIAMEKGLKLKDVEAVKFSMRTVKFAVEASERRSKTLSLILEELVDHTGRKPRK